jgi:hypothetical protein
VEIGDWGFIADLGLADVCDSNVNRRIVYQSAIDNKSPIDTRHWTSRNQQSAIRSPQSSAASSTTP